ncbi:MAG: tRNA (N(6)-L-threonylcarbamoyladenosine(37)-C(2))-methylthiotransferase MtaB [Candidatus Omnitrophota bacterium]|nr:tRNA (N(6)-L-threonylcarbamoyladenosine(37)-C(2))-methylthiotransferase MtaB [Candidatus Omnitrophota bacterium]MDZ4242644.1 tRNA (N(6)-L-threonylcarbamoyladenosine(37)-C(2))-methylthiotransferase MtaB [Candidatus Omnitrophota bacterium]
MKPSISFYTLGCRLNQAETASIQNSFESGGYRVVDFKKTADIVVINTCTVTENGDTDTRRLVNRINRLNPGARIALIGCQAQVQKEKLARLPNVRWVVGNARKMELLSIFEEWSDPDEPQVITPAIEKKPFIIPVAAIDRQHTRANLKIQDGCDFFCSFCEIPYARGRARSREFGNILLEARALAAAGHQEIILTGINVGTYRHDGKTVRDVIDALEQVEGLERIRISSIEPTTVPEALVRKMASGSKLCRYLHIPLQSASDPVLGLMKRKYNFKEFSRFIRMAHETVPEICLGTDVIVGFPGETEEHFRETYDRLLDLPVHYFHVFSYSARHMAKSRDLADPVPVSVIQKRSELLRELSLRKRRVYFESLAGSVQTVLFEQKKGGWWTGLTDHYVRVNLRSSQDLQNRMIPVRLGTTDGIAMTGEILNPSIPALRADAGVC